jgi:hypothetical protein
MIASLSVMRDGYHSPSGMSRPDGKHPAYIFVLALAAALSSAAPVAAAPPQLVHTPNYESPVRGDPDDLLVLPGLGFQATDRVVYELAASTDGHGAQPAHVSDRSGPDLGFAPIVQRGNPPYSLTVRLPPTLRPDGIYRLWVVDAAGEWSRPITINDPRPLWITPSFVFESADPAELGRYVRIVGRNLEPRGPLGLEIKLTGPRTYLLTSAHALASSATLPHYVAEGILPARLVRGLYSVSVSLDGHAWIALPAQRLEVRPNPPPLPEFAVGEPRFGGCRPDDGQLDNACFARAIDAAKAVGGGTIVVPPGTWDLGAGETFVLPPGVHLRGASDLSSKLVRHGAPEAPPPGALFALSGENSIIHVTFVDADPYASRDESKPVLLLGTPGPPTPGKAHEAAGAVSDVIISGDAFVRVGRAVGETGRPIARLFVTHNEFAAYDSALELPGDRFNVGVPFQVADSVIRWNHFVPGSYLDVASRQGSIASGFGASYRVDFSSNFADGASTAGLQRPGDAKGWRAAFFWNMNNSHEMLLVAENRVTCPGDKIADGEAIAFDANGNTFAFNGAQAVTAANADSVAVRAALLAQQNNRAIDLGNYYRGHWLQIVQGPGIGQVRKILAYRLDPATGTVVLRVSPAWDIVPSELSRVVVGREYWQVYAVSNEIDQRDPPCLKSNRSGPEGGTIVMWAPSADSVIDGNRQYDTGGIAFSMRYSVRAPSCPHCINDNSFETALDIRGNLIDGEYDWSSDCSWSGISGGFGASPTPESPPIVEGFGVSIEHNDVRKADGLRGGAIDLVLGWFAGPPPRDWPLLRSFTVFHNEIRDIDGAPPRASCRDGQRARIGIRLDGHDNVRDLVLYGNRCERVATPFDPAENHTTSVCAPSALDDCECAGR